MDRDFPTQKTRELGRMNFFDVILLAFTSWVALIIITGIVMSVFYKNKPIVKSTVPDINILIDLLYLGMIAFNAHQALDHEINCIVYIAFPFFFTFCLGNSYIIKCWRLNVLCTTGAIKDSQYNANQFLAVSIPQSLESMVLVDVDVDESDQDEKKTLVSRHSAFFGLNNWIMRHQSTGRMAFLWKVLLCATILEMAIPLGILFYWNNDVEYMGKCSVRTSLEFHIFFLFAGVYFLIFFLTWIKIRSHPNHHNLKTQLSLSALAWAIVFTCFFVINMSSRYFKNKQEVERVHSVFSVACWLIPFCADTIWPLLRDRLSRINLKKYQRETPTITIEDIIRWGGEREIGWGKIKEFMEENMNVADAEENTFLLHGLYFMKEYIRNAERIAKGRGEHVIENKGKDLDHELCGMVILAWVKYLHKEGDLCWEGEEDKDALFLTSLEDVEILRKELESALHEIVNSSSYDLMNEQEQTKAAKKLRKIYRKIVDNTQRKILTEFRKSNQFESLLNIIKKTESESFR